MNGEIVSGSSGTTGPRSFQFFCRPSLIEADWVIDVVKLNTTANEFASWGQSVVVSLSRYIPSSGTQNTSLYLTFREVAFFVQASSSVLSFKWDARSALVIRTLKWTNEVNGRYMSGPSYTVQQCIAFCIDTPLLQVSPSPSGPLHSSNPKA